MRQAFIAETELVVGTTNTMWLNLDKCLQNDYILI